jgi:uncharacterized membrane-anchored protein
MRHHRLSYATALAALALVGSLSMAQDEPEGGAPTPEEIAAALESQLDYKQGEISLNDGMATVRVPEDFRFLDAQGSRKLLVEGWGNPEGSADGVLGMLVPAGLSPLSDEGWGVVVSYEESGYVSDEDAASIDYDELLAQMQAGSDEENAARAEQGFESIELVGWAEPPSYDGAAHKLYWAKELEFGGNPDHTLNYAVRVLGRRGVLELNAVSSMSQLDEIRRRSASLLGAIEFNPGHRYEEYVPGVDKAATYGLVGLIAGAAAAKAGLFKGLVIALFAAKKFLIVGGIALVALLAKVFGGKKQAAE